MPIVGDGQLNLAALVVDDIYVVIIPPRPRSFRDFLQMVSVSWAQAAKASLTSPT